MASRVPVSPKLYHIVHVDRLESITASDGLFCDAEANSRGFPGTTIGIPSIKRRRLRSRLRSHPDLHVGDCVPFFFCGRSPMLHMIAEGQEQELTYRGGEDPIVHLQADMHRTIEWAERHSRRWAFTTGNAGESEFDDFSSINDLDLIAWEKLGLQPWQTNDWPTAVKAKKSEFLLEGHLPWDLVDLVGCRVVETRTQANAAVNHAKHRPRVLLVQDWYHNL